MAIANAECACATCGKKFEIRVRKSNSREAASFEKWAKENITECKECEKARLQAKYDEGNANAAEAAAEMGYPELIGTEKQVAWANTIREKALAELRDTFMDPECPEKHLYRRLAFTGISHLILRMRQAAWWIDHQNELGNVRSMSMLATQIDRPFAEAIGAIQRAVRDGEKTMAQAEAEVNALINAPAKEASPIKPAQKPAEQHTPERPEAVPEKKRHDGAADVKILDGSVTALYGKDDDFMEIVKRLGFSWGSGWTLKAGEKTGTAENIAAELGSRLLNAGFAVRFDSQEILDKAVRGDYEPMCRRWIQSHSTGFYLSWGREDDHYSAAKAIPGAKYDRPGIIVPERSWDALEDFAARYGYRFTAMAREKMDRLSGRAQVVSPEKAKAPEYDEKDVLQSSREVLEDLKDD